LTFAKVLNLFLVITGRKDTRARFQTLQFDSKVVTACLLRNWKWNASRVSWRLHYQNGIRFISVASLKSVRKNGSCHTDMSRKVTIYIISKFVRMIHGSSPILDQVNYFHCSGSTYYLFYYYYWLRSLWALTPYTFFFIYRSLCAERR